MDGPGNDLYGGEDPLERLLALIGPRVALTKGFLPPSKRDGHVAGLRVGLVAHSKVPSHLMARAASRYKLTERLRPSLVARPAASIGQM